MTYSTYGRHVVADLWEVDFDRINNAEFLQNQLIEAAEKCGATVLSVSEQQFEPQGATVLLLLSESHLSIHTYPEKGFAALDCYTCGDKVDPEVAIHYLLSVLKPKTYIVKKLIRGVGEMIEESPAITSM
ncbi:adenosylmethionine decarboxylase [Paenibacillus sp. MER TA 81-3]|uniref:adenosylmethionine decarboxylase n=1 Tax=Paenibacillus sp. MER TA 81-3 TaxID=2939573 RepID=UPI00203F5795|nr:adenosylmethionine decarboxylase [Paenibacillus sp. MER TA 81-3]MCM3337507.1 adenosylmethionine decarboxylase [Paenibacillus sp. MER TA 81-3]